MSDLKTLINNIKPMLKENNKNLKELIEISSFLNETLDNSYNDTLNRLSSVVTRLVNTNKNQVENFTKICNL